MSTGVRLTAAAVILLAACGGGPAGATASAAGPATAAAWQALYDALPYRGDGNWSARLPDGRSVWVTGDAMPRAGGTWASNTVTVVDGAGSWQTPNVIPDTAAGVVSWLGPVAVSGGKVIATVSRIRRTPGVGIGFVPLGTGIATMSISSGAWWPTVEKVTTTPWSETGINWTAGLHVAGSTVYVFGTRKSSSPWGFDVHVATVPLTSLHDFRKWTVFGRPILRAEAGQGTDTAFSVRRDGTGWHFYTRRGGAWGGEHGEYTAGRIDGTYRWVAGGTEPGYLPAEHPEVRLASGLGLVTVNVTEDGVGVGHFLEVPAR